MLSEGKESGKFAWLLVQSHPEILYTEPEKLYSIGKVLKEVGKLDWFSHKVLTDPTLLGFVYLARDSSDDLIDLITSREKPLSETERKGLSILQ